MPPPKDPIKYELWRKKQAENSTGRKHTEETKRKLSESRKGSNNPAFGTHHTDEWKKHMSSVNKGKIIPLEQRLKISEAKKGSKHPFFGRPFPEEKKKHLSVIFSGINHPQYGKERPEKTRLKLIEAGVGGFWYGNVRYYDGPQYCEKFNENLKERVRAFFGYRCVECGILQNGKKLDVHHVWYNKKACCDNTPRSLVALCHKCHSKSTTGDRTYWSNHFQEMIDLNYNGKCWFTKDEMNELQTKTLLGE
jgi:hypothetical protein